MGHFLVVDDDPQILEVLGRVLRKEGHEVFTAATGAEALEHVERQKIDVLFLDIQMPGTNGLEIASFIRDRGASTCVVLMTGYGTPATAIRAGQLDVLEYLTKPLDLARIRSLAAVAMGEAERRAQARDSSPSPSAAPTGFLGNSEMMREVYRAIGHISNTPNEVTVLIQGESGTGKELAARAIHDHGTHASEPFVAINCTALPETLIESELFGYERGTFTGADTTKRGKLEWAQNGTVFLDEVGDLPVAFQPKLLRLLQERQFERLGGRVPHFIRARFIAATNHNLFADMNEGRFRADLFFRLNGIAVQMPSLREHPEDIPELIDHFLQRSCERLGRGQQEFSPQALGLLCSYSYPGNVRELVNVVEKCTALCSNVRIEVETLPAEVRGQPAHSAAVISPPKPRHAGLSEARRAVLDDFEANYVWGLLQATRGNVTDAARRAGMSRQAFHRLIQRHRVDATAFR